MKNLLIIATLLIIFINSTITKGFNLQGKITIIDDLLNDAAKIKISDLPDKLQNYFSQAEYCDEDINLNYDITLKLKTKIGSNNSTFTAEMQFLETNYNIKYRDKRVTIYYDPTAILIFNEYTFNKLTSIFDYYFYMTIGNILDEYTELGGTKYFQKAERICKDGILKDERIGWERRLAKTEEILSEDLKDYRQAKAIINSGFNALENQDVEVASKNIKHGLELLKKYKNRTIIYQNYILPYIGAIYNDLGEAISYLDNKDELFDIIISIDSVHQNYYNDLKNNN